jgi:CheY-like chemotaxis protein
MGREHDDEFTMFVGNIVQGAKRIRALLGDLLAYAEIGATSNDSNEVVNITLVLKRLDKLYKCPSRRTARRSFAPDLAVLDVNFPKSLAILEAMSKTQAFADLPVAVMSSVLSPSDLAKVQQFNVAHYITKPSTLEDFMRIGFTLKQMVQHASGGRSTGALARR